MGGFCGREGYGNVPVQPKIAGQRGSVEIGNPVLPRGEVFESSAAIEIGHDRGDQKARLRELHDALFDAPLLFTFQVHPPGFRIYFSEFSIEALQRFKVRLNVVAKRLAVLLDLALIFFGIFLLFAGFVFGFRNTGMQSRTALILISFQEFGHIQDVGGGKFFDEVGSRQIDAMMRFHPFLELWRNGQLGDEMIDIHNSAGALNLFANIGKTSGQQVESHSAHRLGLSLRRPRIGAELKPTRRGTALGGPRRGTQEQRGGKNA